MTKERIEEVCERLGSLFEPSRNGPLDAAMVDASDLRVLIQAALLHAARLLPAGYDPVTGAHASHNPTRGKAWVESGHG